jgi:hypothetical protein
MLHSYLGLRTPTVAYLQGTTTLHAAHSFTKEHHKTGFSNLLQVHDSHVCRENMGKLIMLALYLASLLAGVARLCSQWCWEKHSQMGRTLQGGE